MARETPLTEASKTLCRGSRELITTAKATRLEQEICLESKDALAASAAQRLLQNNYSDSNRTGSAMKLKIFLDSDSYECLYRHIARQAQSRVAINSAVLLGHTRVIDCADVEARDLLVTAQSQCPGAVRGITEAMLSAGLTP
jgi:hypothetical protein